MNFKNMPELEWRYGYPFALVMMVIAAVVPYSFFKWKKWLYSETSTDASSSHVHRL